MAKDTTRGQSTKELPTTSEGLAKEAVKLRAKLRQDRLDHALQKLSSPATLRSTRRQLARVLTLQRAGAHSAPSSETPEPTAPAVTKPATTKSAGDSNG